MKLLIYLILKNTNFLIAFTESKCQVQQIKRFKETNKQKSKNFNSRDKI